MAIPNVLLQMLLRGANAVGYTKATPTTSSRPSSTTKPPRAGVDVFRVFDALNDLDSARIAIERIRRTGKVCEVAMCYTGDVANEKRPKYNLDYYADLARRIEDLGARIFSALRTWQACCDPEAAGLLIERLRETVKLPIHLHTHDTSGNGIAALLVAIDRGAHVVDAAFSSMAGFTSQPSLNALVSALRGTRHDTLLANKNLQPLADYWEDVRRVLRAIRVRPEELDVRGLLPRDSGRSVQQPAAPGRRTRIVAALERRQDRLRGRERALR